MDKKIVLAYFLSTKESMFKDKQNGQPIRMYKLNFLSLDDNNPMSFWVSATDYAAKYAQMKTATYVNGKGLQGTAVKLVLQLRETTTNTYKLSLLGLEE